MSVTENTSPAALRAAARDGEAGSRWSIRWAWFGGADASVLRYVPSELSFLSSLGTTIVALAFLSGFVVSVASRAGGTRRSTACCGSARRGRSSSP